MTLIKNKPEKALTHFHTYLLNPPLLVIPPLGLSLKSTVFPTEQPPSKLLTIQSINRVFLHCGNFPSKDYEIIIQLFLSQNNNNLALLYNN